jgi:hypothetical protein
MTIQYSDRIHIAPLGYEDDRVVKPAITTKADRVYLLEHDEPEDEKPDYHATLKEELRDNGIGVMSRVRCFVLYILFILLTSWTKAET